MFFSLFWGSLQLILVNSEVNQLLHHFRLQCMSHSSLPHVLLLGSLFNAWSNSQTDFWRTQFGSKRCCCRMASKWPEWPEWLAEPRQRWARPCALWAKWRLAWQWLDVMWVIRWFGPGVKVLYIYIYIILYVIYIDIYIYIPIYIIHTTLCIFI